jgi:hypothetical protein
MRSKYLLKHYSKLGFGFALCLIIAVLFGVFLAFLVATALLLIIVVLV